jgi:hypothetical protein
LQANNCQQLTIGLETSSKALDPFAGEKASRGGLQPRCSLVLLAFQTQLGYLLPHCKASGHSLQQTG